MTGTRAQQRVETEASARPAKKHKKIHASQVINFAVLILMSAIMLYPFLLIINIALKSYKDFLTDPLGIVSFSSIRWENFSDVWEDLKVFERIWNTLYMTAGACILGCLIPALAAFPISRNHFRGSGKVYTFILASMFFPGSLVASITIAKALALYDSPLGMIIMWGAGGPAMNIFMMVGFTKGLPRDLDDAAFMDGCGYFRYILQIAMPLLMPIIATIITFKAVGCWNDFLNPLIYLPDARYRTISTGLYMFMGSYSNQWPLLACAILIIASPMVVLYLFMQRFIIEGMISGALKG